MSDLNSRYRKGARYSKCYRIEIRSFSFMTNLESPSIEIRIQKFVVLMYYISVHREKNNK